MVGWLLLAPSIALGSLVDAIEYYNAALDHYFVTAFPDEIAKLDSGFFAGWQRTGQSFKVSDAGSPLPGGTPVCRFYGNPSAGLDSHFYSASPTECMAVQQKFANAWLLESNNVFQVYQPNTTTGACPGGSVPIYRAWNNRSDSNHRYTTSLATLQSMLAKGYIAEGYGPPAAPVAMCSPAAGEALPQCVVTTTNASPVVTSPITLMANCSGNPATFAWSGCASSTSTCTVTSNTAGNVTYSVQATNASGTGPSAAVTVFWRAMLPPSAAPACFLTYTSKTDPPTVGSGLLLNANCTQAPFSYTWTGCASMGSTCVVTETTPGPHTYTVIGRNEGGDSAPASLTSVWSASPPPAPGFCGQYPAVLRSYLGWNNSSFFSLQYTDPPGFAWNGVWAITLTVPAAPAPTTVLGRVAVAEYGGVQTSREMTISRFPCDFRPLDPTGSNGPVFHDFGLAVIAQFTAGAGSSGVPGLLPGQTYFVNIRNAVPSGAISCAESLARCDAVVEIDLPR